MDEQLALTNMITQQVRAWGVYDDEVLDLLKTVPRSQFVPAGYEQLAYADTQIPLGKGQTMLAPKEIGRILDALDILPTETVLEIGTGTGYLTALLARQANHVYSVEVEADKSVQAQEKLKKLNLADNITFLTGDGAKGWPQNAPYDIIIITGSLPELPREFKEQLNTDGRIFAILGNNPNMEATLLTKRGENSWQAKTLYETSAPRLLYVEEFEPFSF